MLITIIKKEILEHLKSAKFLIGLGIIVIMMTGSTFINIQNYVQRHKDYLKAQEIFTGQNPSSISIFRPPQVLSILVTGKDRSLGNRLELNPYSDLPMFPSDYNEQYSIARHRFFAGFQAVDFSFVVKIALSLMVIFLAYDAISGEKAQGTLRSVLANRLPKDQFLFGKLAGGVIVISGAFLISFLLILLIMLFHPDISLAGTDWGRIAGLFGLSLLYLFFFFALTLFVSVIVNRPSMTLMVLLQIWIFLIIIYPNLSIRFSERFNPLPSFLSIEMDKFGVVLSSQKEMDRLSEKRDNAFTKGGQAADDELDTKKREIEERVYQKRHEIDLEFSRRMTQQMRSAQFLSILSPAVLYDMAAEKLALTDVSEFDRFMKSVDIYRQNYAKWFWLDAKKRNTAPVFIHPKDTISRTFTGTIPSWILLFLLSLIFFALAYACFLRKDVR